MVMHLALLVRRLGHTGEGQRYHANGATAAGPDRRLLPPDDSCSSTWLAMHDV